MRSISRHHLVSALFNHHGALSLRRLQDAIDGVRGAVEARLHVSMIDCFALLRSDRDTANRPSRNRPSRNRPSANRPSRSTELVKGRTNRRARNPDEPGIGLIHLYDQIERSRLSINAQPRHHTAVSGCEETEARSQCRRQRHIEATIFPGMVRCISTGSAPSRT